MKIYHQAKFANEANLLCPKLSTEKEQAVKPLSACRECVHAGFMDCNSGQDATENGGMVINS